MALSAGRVSLSPRSGTVDLSSIPLRNRSLPAVGTLKGRPHRLLGLRPDSAVVTAGSRLSRPSRATHSRSRTLGGRLQELRSCEAGRVSGLVGPLTSPLDPSLVNTFDLVEVVELPVHPLSPPLEVLFPGELVGVDGVAHLPTERAAALVGAVSPGKVTLNSASRQSGSAASISASTSVSNGSVDPSRWFCQARSFVRRRSRCWSSHHSSAVRNSSWKASTRNPRNQDPPVSNSRTSRRQWRRRSLGWQGRPSLLRTQRSAQPVQRVLLPD